MCILKQWKTIQLYMYFGGLLLENGCLSQVTKYMLHVYLLLQYFTKTYLCVLKQGTAIEFQYKQGVICSYYFKELLMENRLLSLVPNKWYVYCLDLFETRKAIHFNKNGDEEGEGVGAEGDLQLILYKRALSGEWIAFPCYKTHSVFLIYIWHL